MDDPVNQENTSINNIDSENNIDNNKDSIFTDDSSEMRKELSEAISSSMPQMNAKPSEEFQKYFEFLPKVMDILGFDESKKQQKMNEFYFGIEAIALERLVDMMDPEAKEKFTNLFETTDSANVTQEVIAQFQNDLKANTDNERIFKAYFSAVSAMVDLVIEDLMSQANEEQGKEIRKILLEQQDKIENMTINVVSKDNLKSL